MAFEKNGLGFEKVVLSWTDRSWSCN